MQSKLVACGRILKGRHPRYLIVLLDDSLRPAGAGNGESLSLRRVVRTPARRPAARS